MNAQVIGMVFQEEPGTPMRWLVGVVLDMLDGRAWVYVEIAPLACPDGAVPTSVIAALHRQLSAMSN